MFKLLNQLSTNKISIPQIKKNAVLVLFLLFLSGNPILKFWGIDYILIGFLIILLFQKNILNVFLKKKTGLIIASFILIFLIQTIQFKFFPITTYSGFFIRLLIALVLVYQVREFCKYFIIILYYLSLISIVFWLFQIIYPSITDYCIPITTQNADFSISLFTYSLIIHTFSPELRNCGMFSEPGLFAGYINLALLILFSQSQLFEPKISRKILIVLSIALISTFSTQGYLTYFFLLIFVASKFLINLKVNKLKKHIVIVISFSVFISICYIVYTQASFLQEKIDKEINATENQIGNYKIKRVGGFIESLNYIYTKPLVGWGLNDTTRNSMSDSDVVYGTGMTDFIAKVGIPIFLLLMYYLYCFFRYSNSIESSFYLVFVFIVLLQGEPFFTYPLIFCFFFIQMNTHQLYNNADPENSYINHML